MTTSTVAPPRLGGWRLLATLTGAILAAITSGVAITRALPILAPAWAADPDKVAVVVIAAVYLFVTLALLAGLGRRTVHRKWWLSLTLPTLRSLAFGVTAWAGAYTAALLLYTATTPLGLTRGDAVAVLWAVGADNGRLSDASPLLTLLILARVCLLAPFAEELLFRGALFTWLRDRLTAPWTIALTAAGFALIHQTPAMLPLATTVGLAAGIVRERTGSVGTLVSLHVMQNVGVVVLSFLVTGWQASLPF